jgi:peptidoglycan-N-acetylglucosamine deacetylase
MSMLCNYHRMIAACTCALILLSSHSVNPSGNLVHASLKSKVRAPRAVPYRIYLTFDDGPCSGSEEVNELSAKDSLQINVFLIGRNVCLTQKSRDRFRQYQANSFVEIGNHSYTHAERKYDSYFNRPSGVLADFNRSRDSLGLENGLARLPGRNFFRLHSCSRNEPGNGKEAADTLAASGYRVFGWDLEWRNHAGKGIGTHTGQEMFDLVNRMVESQKTFLPGHLIILLHDPELRDDCFRADLEEFIKLVKGDRRYCFGHLSDLIK